MEKKSITSFKPAPYNPRVLDTHDAESLDRSIERWGDISGVTANVQTGNLCTGHQRVGILRGKFGDARVKIQITNRNEKPDEHNTVATGFVVVDGTNIKLSYREVSISADEEKALNIAANKIGGRFDDDMLTQINKELAGLENAADLLEATGQDASDVQKMLNEIDDNINQAGNDEPKNGDGKLTFSVTQEQGEIIEEALGNILATREVMTAENSNMKSNALFFMARDYLDRLHGLAESADKKVMADPEGVADMIIGADVSDEQKAPPTQQIVDPEQNESAA